MKQYKLFNISWETDGLDVDLPSEVIVDVDEDDAVEYVGADILSDKYGWLVNCFEYEKVN